MTGNLLSFRPFEGRSDSTFPALAPANIADRTCLTVNPYCKEFGETNGPQVLKNGNRWFCARACPSFRKHDRSNISGALSFERVGLLQQQARRG